MNDDSVMCCCRLWSVGSWGAVWEVTMAIEPTKTTSNPAKPIWDVDPFGLNRLSVIKNPFAVNDGNGATALSEYLVDAFQRSVLFLDVLRRRGNDEEEMS